LMWLFALTFRLLFCLGASLRVSSASSSRDQTKSQSPPLAVLDQESPGTPVTIHAITRVMTGWQDIVQECLQRAPNWRNGISPTRDRNFSSILYSLLGPSRAPIEIAVQIYEFMYTPRHPESGPQFPHGVLTKYS
jgi:hypothetical protein